MCRGVADCLDEGELVRVPWWVGGEGGEETGVEMFAFVCLCATFLSCIYFLVSTAFNPNKMNKLAPLPIGAMIGPTNTSFDYSFPFFFFPPLRGGDPTRQQRVSGPTTDVSGVITRLVHCDPPHLRRQEGSLALTKCNQNICI